MPGGHPVLHLDTVHCRAICDEIGDRLRTELDRSPAELPPRLRLLLEALAAQDNNSPSIVPDIEDLQQQAVAEFGKQRGSWHLGMGIRTITLPTLTRSSDV